MHGLIIAAWALPSNCGDAAKRGANYCCRATPHGRNRHCRGTGYRAYRLP